MRPYLLATHRHQVTSSHVNGRLSCGSPRLVALGTFRALTKLKAVNDLPHSSQAALGLFGLCNVCLHVCTVCIWRCQHAIFIHSLVNTLESHGSVHTDHGIKLQLVQDGKTQLSEIDMICNNWRREGSVCLLSIELHSHSRSASQRKRASRATCTGKIVSVSSETWGNLCLQSIQWVTPSPLLIYCDCDHRHNPKSQSNISSSKRKAIPKYF